MFNHLVTPSGTKIAHSCRRPCRVRERRARASSSPCLQTLASERILRPVGGADGSARYEIFHDVLADAVLAWRTRYGSERELQGERARAARRQRRTVAGAVVAAAVIAVLAAATVYALVQRGNARTAATRAHARELVAQARAELGVHPLRSVALAARGARLEPSIPAEETLRTALRGLYLDAIFQMDGPVVTVQFSPDGRFVVAAAGDDARIFRVRDHRLVRTLRHGAPITGAWFDPKMRLVLTAGEDGVARAWNLATGGSLAGSASPRGSTPRRSRGTVALSRRRATTGRRGSGGSRTGACCGSCGIRDRSGKRRSTMPAHSSPPRQPIGTRASSTSRPDGSCRGSTRSAPSRTSPSLHAAPSLRPQAPTGPRASGMRAPASSGWYWTATTVACWPSTSTAPATVS